MTRVVYKTATPRDLKSLSVTTLQIPKIKEELAKLSDSTLLKKLNLDIDLLDEIANLIENSIVDEPPLLLKMVA